MSERYKIDRTEAKRDYLDLSNKIQTLLSTPDLDPVTFLDLDRVRPFTGHITAPYRLDCALTYKLPDTDDPNSAPIERVDQELNTDQWKLVIDKAWQAGIPHIIFTGGEPTLRDDISELLLHAEMNGQVTGLLTNGLKLEDKAYLDTLLATGLDHLMLIFQFENESFMKALRNSLAEDIFVGVHFTLNNTNENDLVEKIVQLSNMGVKAISLSTADQELIESLEGLREQVAESQLDLVWNLPVPYSTLNPIDLETEKRESSLGEGKAWLYVEPDGDILPAQGVNRVLGNIIQDEWHTIWGD
jgi:MoaA/NifB/PqqE/SkfB family radical SAM enzyme